MTEEIQVLQILNPNGIEIEEVRSLIDRGLDANPVTKPRTGAMEAIRDAILSDTSDLFVARKGSEWSGYIVLDWNPNPTVFEMESWVVYLYSNGDSGVRSALMGETKTWAESRGIKSVFWINRSGRTDDAMMSLAPDGFDNAVVGSLIESKREEG